MSIETFKRAFQKVALSDRDNYEIRRAKCQAAIDDLAQSIADMRAYGLVAGSTDRHRRTLEALNKLIAEIDKVAALQAGEGFRQLEQFKQTAVELAAEARLMVASRADAVRQRLADIREDADLQRRIERAEALLEDIGGDQTPEGHALEDLLADARKQSGVAQAKQAYALQFTQQSHQGDGGHAALNPDGKFKFNNLADDLGDLADPTRLAELKAKYPQLSEGEILAIRAYTAKNFEYINPAVANQKDKQEQPRDWMDRNLPADATAQQVFREGDGAQPGSKKGLYEEGALHAGMIVEALRKLPRAPGTVYRGARTTVEKFNARYQLGGFPDYEAFSSTSSSEDSAYRFCCGDGLKNIQPNDPRTVSVLEIAEVQDAWDIKDFSVYPKEDERLLLPAIRLQVTLIEDDPDQFKGNPEVPATLWKIVRLRQVCA